MPIVRKIDGALVRLVDEMAGIDELLHAVQKRGHIPPASQQQRTRASKRRGRGKRVEKRQPVFVSAMRSHACIMHRGSRVV